MIRHIFLDKTATIIKDSEANTGLNPIAELNYGNAVTRFILHFDESKIKAMFEDGTIPQDNLDNVRFVLKMTNTGAIDGVPYEKPLKFGNTCITQERAVSFTVLALKLPCGFDAGRGFEFVSDVWVTKGKSYSREGCNWYQCRNGQPWDEPGVYSAEKIKREYDKKYPNNGDSGSDESLVITRQHFDFGDENLELDITDYVVDILKGNQPNFGILVCFTPATEVLNGRAVYTEIKPDSSIMVEIPELEEMPSYYDITVPEYFKIPVKEENEVTGEIRTVFKYYHKTPSPIKVQQYVGFFTDNTNTFFHPYVEVQYDVTINDDRERFFIGRNNNLCLYVNIDGMPESLDEAPVCTLEGCEPVVSTPITKGVYCASFIVDNGDPNSILEDTWSNIKYKGVEQDDVILETVLLPKTGFINLGNSLQESEMAIPAPYGINDDETIKRGDIREVVFDFREKYTTNHKVSGVEGWYRLYTKSGEQQIDILNGYQPLERAYLKNYFVLYTEDLIPNNRYYVDVKIKSGREVRFYEDVLHFRIGDDVTERYV